MAKKKPDWKLNELEVIELLNEIPGVQSFEHPDGHAHYDIGAKVDRKALHKDYPLWKSDYYDDSIEESNLAVEVKNRSRLYAFFWMQVDKVADMKNSVHKERSKKGTAPLYCCSYIENGEKVHAFYDVRWIETFPVVEELMQDQTMFKGSRQGVKIKKKVHRFPSNQWIFKLQKGKGCVVNEIIYNVEYAAS